MIGLGDNLNKTGPSGLMYASVIAHLRISKANMGKLMSGEIMEFEPMAPSLFVKTTPPNYSSMDFSFFLGQWRRSQQLES